MGFSLINLLLDQGFAAVLSFGFGVVLRRGVLLAIRFGKKHPPNSYHISFHKCKHGMNMRYNSEAFSEPIWRPLNSNCSPQSSASSQGKAQQFQILICIWLGLKIDYPVPVVYHHFPNLHCHLGIDHSQISDCWWKKCSMKSNEIIINPMKFVEIPLNSP